MPRSFATVLPKLPAAPSEYALNSLLSSFPAWPGYSYRTARHTEDAQEQLRSDSGESSRFRAKQVPPCVAPVGLCGRDAGTSIIISRRGFERVVSYAVTMRLRSDRKTRILKGLRRGP